MPGFGRSKFKLRNDIPMVDDDGNPHEYRAVAFIQYRTEWDEAAGKFTPMTDDQKEMCNELQNMMFEAGVELGISLTKRIPNENDVRTFPKVATFSLVANDPAGYQGGNNG